MVENCRGLAPVLFWLTLLAGVLTAATSCLAEAPSLPAPTAEHLLLFPPDDIYPPYIADPHRTGFGAQRMWYTRREIPASGGDRLLLNASGTFGLVRVQPEALPEGAWQVSAIGGIIGMYDMENAQDNIGWDGIYGLLGTGLLTSEVAWKLGLHHISAHLGDEYVERTGRGRLGYTREELLGGVSWAPAPRWRLYGEGGWAYGVGNRQLMEPWRLQGGVEYSAPTDLWRQRLGYYGALNVSAMEERNWRLDTTGQAGLVLRSFSHNWRLGVEYHNGAPPLGEFFQVSESYFSAGIWLDL
jgi:uncharacterized protein DUF1207